MLRFALLSPIIVALLSASSVAQAPVDPGQPSIQVAEADMHLVRQHLIQTFLPTESQEIQALSRDAQNLINSLRADGKWPDIKYDDTSVVAWGPSNHVGRLVTLARTYVSPGQPFYQDKSLKQKIELALGAFFQGNYKSANWWFNDISVPGKVGSILLLLGDDISPDLRELCLSNLQSSADHKPMRGSSGANLVWLAKVQLMRGLALPSPALVAESFDTVWSEIKISRQGVDGIQADYSFHQHGPLIYNGGYATSFVSDIVAFRSYAQGTAFALPDEKERVLVNLVLNGQDWMFWKGAFDPSVRGRDITRPDSGKVNNWRRDVEKLADGARWRQAELIEASKRSSPNAKPLEGNRHFWNSDFMVHRRKDYYTSVRMFSTRTRNTDGTQKEGAPINGDGRSSHHVADGATYIWQRGDEYNDIFPVWDWNLVPGTTAVQAPLDQNKVAFRGSTNLVGGASDGTYGMAAMKLSRETLRATKAWFYFDDEIVALGAGIADSSNYDVRTAVNQSRLIGPVEVSNSRSPVPFGEREVVGAHWVLHDKIGYIFPKNIAVHLANRERSALWSESGSGSPTPVTQKVFTLSLEHGINPSNATYEYIIVPNATRTDLEKRIKKPQVETLCNSPALQAVRHNGLKLVQAAFYNPGTLKSGAGWNIEVSKPCLVVVRQMGKTLEVTVSNPENKALKVEIGLDRQLNGPTVALTNGKSRLRFDLPGGFPAASSVTQTFTEK